MAGISKKAKGISEREKKAIFGEQGSRGSEEILKMSDGKRRIVMKEITVEEITLPHHHGEKKRMGSLCREHEEALIYCRFSNLSQAIAMTGFLLENKLTRTPASLVIAVRHCSCVCSFSVLSPLRSQRSQQLRL